MKIALILLLFSMGFLSEPSEHYATCSEFKCIENHKNQKGQVAGVIRAYTPNKKGKGAGHMFWDYEILLADSIAIPVVSAAQSEINFKPFLGEKVLIKCTFYYGVVIAGGHENAQAATGWRIDASEIKKN